MSLASLTGAGPVLGLFLALFQANPPAAQVQDRLVGTWAGRTREGDQVVFHFRAEGKVTLRYIEAEDEEAPELEDVGEGTYRLDRGARPLALDLNWKKRGNVRTIIEFTDVDSLRVQNNQPGRGRPAAFTGDHLVFRRVREGTPPRY